MTSKIGSKDSYSFSQTKTETTTYYVNNGLCIAFCVFPWGRDPRTRTLDMDGMRHRRSRNVVGLLVLWISQYGALWMLYDICHNSPCTANPFNTSWKIQRLGLYNHSKLNVKEKPFFSPFHPICLASSYDHTCNGDHSCEPDWEYSYKNKWQQGQPRMVTLTTIL